MFSAEHAIPYLLSIGLLSPGDVVDGRTRLTPLLTRNYTLLATVADVPRFVLKQARATTRETLVHETRVCRALAASSDAQVKQIAPGVAHYDDSAGILVLRAFPGRNLNRWHRRDTRSRRALAARSLPHFLPCTTPEQIRGENCDRPPCQRPSQSAVRPSH